MYKRQHVDGGGADALRGQLMDEQADAEDVRHGVQAAHLVEVYLLHGLAMDFALRLGQQPVYLQGDVYKRQTLDGHLYKEFVDGQVTAKELSDGEMPEAYRRFGLEM